MTRDANRHLRVKIYAAATPEFQLSLYLSTPRPIAEGPHWPFVVSLLTGVWKPEVEGGGKRMRGEMHINHVSSICKPGALTFALCAYARHTLFPENMTTWLSHTAPCSCTLLPSGGVLRPGAHFSTANQLPESTPPPTSLSGYHSLGHCIPDLITMGQRGDKWGEPLCAKPTEIILPSEF